MAQFAAQLAARFVPSPKSPKGRRALLHTSLGGEGGAMWGGDKSIVEVKLPRGPTFTFPTVRSLTN